MTGAAYLLHASDSASDRYARYRWLRFRRVGEVRELRAAVVALQDLKFGMVGGKPTAVEIAGGVRQFDIFHAPSVAKHDPTIIGRMTELAFRMAAVCDITHATHKISSVKLLLTPAQSGSAAAPVTLGEQLVHWDFTSAFLTQGMHTMLWHLSEADGQRTTALPRFAAHHQPDQHTLDHPEELRAFIQPLFNKGNYESAAAHIGDVTLPDQCVPHFGTANASSQQRVVAFFMFVPIGA